MSANWRVIVAAVVGAVALLPACAAQPAAPTTGAGALPIPVKIARAVRGSVAASLTYSGNIQTKAQVNVLPKIGGRIERLDVDVGSAVREGDVIAVIDSATLKTQVAQAEAALALAQARLATIEEGPRAAAVAQAEASARAAAEKVASLRNAARAETIAQAEANLRAAEAKLEQIKKGATAEQTAAAKLQVEQARNGLTAAQANRDGICGNGRIPQFQCDAANAQVNAAETGWHQAEAQLAILLAPATPEVLAQAQAAVDAAKQQLELAKSPITSHDVAQAQAAAEAAARAVDLARQPFTENDRKAAQAAVDQAKAALEAARIQVRDATIVAPFDAKVSQRHLAQGAMAGPTTPIVTLVASEVEVIINVEEARLQQVAVGQKATVSVAAYPGEEFPSSVVARAPSLDPRSRTLAVRVRPEPTDRLLDGMFAQVRIVSETRDGVLLIPLQAVLQKEGKTSVFVVVDGQTARLRELKTGVGDGKVIEVRSGVAEGEEVVVAGQENLVDAQAVTIRQ